MIYTVEHKKELPAIGKQARKIYDDCFTIEKFDESVKRIAEQ